VFYLKKIQLLFLILVKKTTMKYIFTLCLLVTYIQLGAQVNCPTSTIVLGFTANCEATLTIDLIDPTFVGSATIVVEDGIGSDNVIQGIGNYKYVVTNNNDNNNTCMGFVSIPSINCPNATVEKKLEVGCEATLTIDLIDPTFLGSAAIVVEDGIGSDNVIQGVGRYQYVATDNNCEFNTCRGFVSLSGFSCPSSAIVLDFTANCEATLTIDLIDPTFLGSAAIVVEDGIGSDNVIQGIGTYQYVVINNDCESNTCRGFVSIPGFSCTASIIEKKLEAGCEATLTIDLIDPTFLGSATIVVEDGVGSDNVIQGCGTYQYVVTDNSCEFNTCRGFVTAIDDEFPIIDFLPPNISELNLTPLTSNDLQQLLFGTPVEYKLDGLGNVILGSFSSQNAEDVLNSTGIARFVDNCGDITVTVSDALITGNNVELIRRTFRARDACKSLSSASYDQDIIVTSTNNGCVDNFKCPSSLLELNLDDGCEAVLSMDLIDPRFTGSVTIVVEDGVGSDNVIQGCGTYQYVVTDNNCEFNTCRGFVTAVDDEFPIIDFLPPTVSELDDVPFNCNDLEELLFETPEEYRLDKFGNIVPGFFSSQIAEDVLNRTGIARFVDNCGDIIVTVSDSLITGSNTFIIRRRFQAQDLCGGSNSAYYDQRIIVTNCGISIVLSSNFNPGDDNKITPGDSITYSYKVENIGKTILTNVLVSSLPGSLTGTGTEPIPEYIVNSSSMNSPEGILLPEEMALYEGFYLITLEDIGLGEVDYQALVTGIATSGAIAEDISDSSNEDDKNETGDPGQADESDPTNTKLEVVELPTMGQWSIICLAVLVLGVSIKYQV
jgi:uncharacterized repeat protein (TIGR01451 family)